MLRTKLLFRDVHLSALSAASIVDMVFDPDKLRKPFWFLATPNDYINTYQSLFLNLYKSRIAAPAADRTGIPRLPFIRGLGVMMPLAGNEIRNQPPYCDWGAQFQELCNLSILPLKIRPNWGIAFRPDLAKRFKLSELSCRSVAKLYPFGAVSYRVRVRLKSKNGIDLDALIELLGIISKADSLVVGKKTFDLLGLVAALHSKILKDITGDSTAGQSAVPHPVHRIVTLNETQPLLDPQTMQRELAAIVGLQQKLGIPQDSYVRNHTAAILDGKSKGQFFLFHPESTLIHSAFVPDESKPQDAKYEDYVRTCLRRNLTAVLEFAMIDEVLTTDLRSALQHEAAVSSPSFDRIQELKDLTERVRGRVEIFDPNQNLYWGKRVHGIHSKLLAAARSFPSWQSSIGKLLAECGRFDCFIMYSREMSAVVEIAKCLVDADGTLAQLEQNAVSYGCPDVGPVKSLRIISASIQSDLDVSARTLGDIKRREGTPEQLDTDELSRNTAEKTLSNACQDLEEKFLPGYESLAVSLVNRATSPTVPPSQTSDLSKAQQLLAQAVAAKSKLQKAYGSVDAFYTDAKPYLTPLPTAVKLALSALTRP